MKIINLEQGSQEWLSWRKTVITATDCSCIMGNNPWTTENKCWQRKLGLIPEQKSNEAMERGKRLEPEARAHFNERYGFDMNPEVVESSEFNFLGASLDGISESGYTILEIKCGGSKLHSMASKGEIPQYYLDQMQHQLLVTGASKCFYYSYDGTDGICIEVFPEPEFKEKFMPKAREFWRCIAFNEPPPLQDSDYDDKNHDLDLQEDLKAYEELAIAIKALEEKKDLRRKKIIERCGDQSSICHGNKIMKMTMRGRVDYEQIPEIKNLDLEKYRKKAIETWKILIA
jgi:putative phage-type endonuclease